MSHNVYNRYVTIENSNQTSRRSGLNTGKLHTVGKPNGVPFRVRTHIASTFGLLTTNYLLSSITTGRADRVIAASVRVGSANTAGAIHSASSCAWRSRAGNSHVQLKPSSTRGVRTASSSSG